MDRVRVEVVRDRRADRAAGRVVRAEHEVVDEQLRATVEQLRERLGPVGGLEAVVLLDRHPGKLPALPRQLLVAAGELFSSASSSSRAACHSSCVPALAASPVVNFLELRDPRGEARPGAGGGESGWSDRTRPCFSKPGPMRSKTESRRVQTHGATRKPPDGSERLLPAAEKSSVASPLRTPIPASMRRTISTSGGQGRDCWRWCCRAPQESRSSLPPGVGALEGGGPARCDGARARLTTWRRPRWGC